VITAITAITHSVFSTHDIYKCYVYRVIKLIKQRKDSVKFRNVRLSIETYNKLDRYLLELMQKRGDRRISLDDAIKSLIDESHSKKTRT
jgi:hypothetical protein